jgi:hypothetical protein
MDVKDSLIYKEFLALKEEVLKHKWYESERKGYDVGFHYAIIDWTLKYKVQWFKERYKKVSL